MIDFDVVDALDGFAEDLESNVSFAKRLHSAVVKLKQERDEALRLLATRVEAKRLDEAQEEIAALRAKVRTITEHYKPGWVDGLKAVARSAGFDPDDAPHDGVDPPTFIEDVIDMLRRDVRDLKAENERLRVARGDYTRSAFTSSDPLFKLTPEQRTRVLADEERRAVQSEDMPPTCEFCDKLRCACKPPKE